jgi:predicted O-methyltransferase YrrM
MKSALLTKIVAAGPGRRSRLHDEKGNFIGFKRLLQNGPRAISSGVLRLAAGYRPATPWISYAAIDLLEKFLHKNSRVLEFGSGMSTIWYAKRAGEVYAVEDSCPWHARVVDLISRAHLQNVHLHYAEQTDEYSQFMANDPAGFDLIVVDGNYRHKCTIEALPLLRNGGIFYLDNSDRGVISKDADTRKAEAAILEFARERSAEISWFTDFAPTQFFVQQGLMIKLPV